MKKLLHITLLSSLIFLLSIFIFQQTALEYASIIYYKIISTDQILSKIDNIYFINLDRSLDRRSNMDKRLKKTSLSYERFTAIDGNNIKLENTKTHQSIYAKELFCNCSKSQLNGKYIIDCASNDEEDYLIIDFKDQNVFSKLLSGEYGCACSHRKLWKSIIDMNYQNTIILEDDIEFTRYFKEKLASIVSNLPYDYDIIWFTLTGEDENKSFDLGYENVFFKKLKGNFASAGMYMLSQKGAKILYNNSKMYNLPIDLLMANLVKDSKLQAYYSNVKLAYQPNNISTIR